MTNSEHLNRIVAKCRELVTYAENERPLRSRAIAGWRATIAAIEEFQDLSDWGASCADFSRKAMQRIIAAWPEELL